MPPEINELEYAAFEEGILEFSEEFLKFDWGAPVDSAWNCAALRSFVQLFKIRVERGDWAAVGITEAAINNRNLRFLIRKKWLYLQVVYEKLRIRSMDDQETKDAFEREEQIRMKRARHVSRRKEVSNSLYIPMFTYNTCSFLYIESYIVCDLQLLKHIRNGTNYGKRLLKLSMLVV